MRYYCICITLLVLGSWRGRMEAQTIRGYVFEVNTNVPVVQAEVYVIGGEGTEQVITDADGQFVYEPGYAGRYDIIISHVAYELVHLQALQLGATKDMILDIPMAPRIRELTEVNILAPSVRRIQNRFYTTSVEETTRLPGTFFDPARTAQLFPGVFTANDQANGLVINGITPKLMQWYLEGVPVLNPNHLANAGTLSDRATATAGGVNMLSNQVLAASTLMNGALPVRYGQAVSGVMDIKFRQGNRLKNEHTVQAGLLGIEGASEGPLGKNSQASYLVNYRYSTVGLLSLIGIDFGDEQINFQDLNFNLHIPLKTPGAYVRVFGVGGLNRNKLDGPRDPEEREDSRDISKIDYKSGAIIGGATLQLPTRKGVIRITSALSHLNSERDEDRLTGNDPPLSPYSFENSKQTQWSSRLDWQGPRLNRFSFNTGLSMTFHWLNGMGDYPQSGPFDRSGDMTLIRPYAQLSYIITGDIVMRGGIALSAVTKNNNGGFRIVPEPSLHIYWQAGEKFSIESGYRYSGIPTPEETIIGGLAADLLRSHTFSFIFRNQIRDGTQWAGIIHYYAMTHVPASDYPSSGFTILSDDGYPFPGAYDRSLIQDGKGRAISLALSLRQEVHRGSFGRAGVGWVHSTHRGMSQITHSTAFDTGPWAFVAAGKEWEKSKSWGPRVFGIDGAVHWHGGLRDQEIDLDASRDEGYTKYADEGNFVIDLPDYFRVDLRVYLRKDKPNKTTTWSLDIQNLFSKENAYFSIYDPFQEGIRETKQLGIIPVLSYRVDF